MGLSGNETQVTHGKRRSVGSSRSFAEQDCSLLLWLGIDQWHLHCYWISPIMSWPSGSFISRSDSLFPSQNMMWGEKTSFSHCPFAVFWKWDFGVVQGFAFLCHDGNLAKICYDQMAAELLSSSFSSFCSLQGAQRSGSTNHVVWETVKCNWILFLFFEFGFWG